MHKNIVFLIVFSWIFIVFLISNICVDVIITITIAVNHRYH